MLAQLRRRFISVCPYKSRIRPGTSSSMQLAMGTPPPGGDRNRASEIYAFTWILEIISVILVVGRMYSRIKLTRNVWWDDWCICIAMVSLMNRQ